MSISLNPTTLLNGNGIDVASLVTQILQQRSGQIGVWQNQLSALQTQASALNTIKTDLTSLQTAVNALSDPTGALVAISADSSIPAIVTATATSKAISGTHTIVVSALASAGTVYTQPIAGGADASFLPGGATGGDLKLQIGGSGGSVKDIPITIGSNDSLNKLVSYINQQSSANNWGVTASVLSDANGARLAIYSQQTGAPGALAITENTSYGVLSTADLASPDATILPSGKTTGDIKLQVGGSGGTTYDIPITAGSNDTLNSLASDINTQSQANSWGVTASVVQDSGGYHLSLSASGSGAASALAFTSNNTILTAIGLNFQPSIGGTNASFSIDGVPYASTTNTVSDALPGVTLKLVGAEDGVPVQLTVGPDTTQASNAINAFVISYNALITAINHQFTVDPTTNDEGPLGSDSSLHNLQSRILQNVGGYSLSGKNGLVNLRSLGINMNNDGTLTVDNTTMNDAMTNNAAAFLNFFQNSSGMLTTADLASAGSSILRGVQTTGDIQLQVGGSTGATYDIPITQGYNDTLTTLASYINTQSQANSWGVTATVVQDSGGYHLLLSSNVNGSTKAVAFTSNSTILTTIPTGFANNFSTELSNLTSPTTGPISLDLLRLRPSRAASTTRSALSRIAWQLKDSC